MKKKTGIFVVVPGDYNPKDPSYPGGDSLPQLYVVCRERNLLQSALDSYQMDSYDELWRGGSMARALRASRRHGEPKPQII